MDQKNSESNAIAIDHQKHWDAAYTKTPNEKLGWYENDLKPTFDLIHKSTLQKDGTILIAGAGSTTLIDALLNRGYSKLIATDISRVSLQKLEDRIGKDKIETITDDLTHPIHLSKIGKVDFWIDRAVLHFLITKKDQKTYFDLLKSKVKKGGFVLLAEFGVGGATKCCGLPIQQYENSQFQDNLGADFELTETFDHVYHNPNGDPRKYIYSLFIRN